MAAEHRSTKQRVSDDQRAQVLELRRRHSLRQVADMTGLPLGTVKTLVSRSGAFRDNEQHRALFSLPPMQESRETLPMVPEMPRQQRVTGDTEVDALLWLREVINTGEPALIDRALEAATCIASPLDEVEQRYTAWLQRTHPGNLFAALSSFNFANLEGLANRARDRRAKQIEARARFGDQIEALTEAEQFCEEALHDVTGDLVKYDKAEVADRFRARPELMPYTLADCLHELDFWSHLYWLRHAVIDWGDGPFESIAREWFVRDLLGEIRPRNREEAKAVLLYLVQQHGDYRLPDVDAVLLNLLGGSASD